MKSARVFAFGLLALTGFAQERAQQARARIDVQTVALDAQIDPTAQTLSATAKVTFIPLDNTSSVTFELNNALNLTRVTDVEGRQITASRFGEDMSVRLSMPQVLPKGQPATLVFVYSGKLTGQEDSPVFGIKFAAITPDVAYLMYPARWFPVNDYTVDRFASDFKLTVPEGYHVVASGNGVVDANAPAGMRAERFQFTQASFPGSIAVVRGEPRTVSADGVTTQLYVRNGAAVSQAYGEEIAKCMVFFTDLFGLPFKKNLVVVETEAGTPNGYAGPGIIFLAPKGMTQPVNMRLVANEVARQWWGTLLSPVTRNHMWIEKWPCAVFRDPVSGARERRERARSGNSRYLRRSADGGSAAVDSIGAAGRLLAGILGGYGQQGCGGFEHVALHYGR